MDETWYFLNSDDTRLPAPSRGNHLRAVARVLLLFLGVGLALTVFGAALWSLP